MKVTDILLSLEELSQANIWKDKDGLTRIHQSGIESNKRLSVLASLKTIRAIQYYLIDHIVEAPNFITNLDDIITELEQIMESMKEQPESTDSTFKRLI